MTCHTKVLPIKLKPQEDEAAKGEYFLGPRMETKFDELKLEVISKIEKELADSKNARDYISQKYDELCKKIQFLTEMDATVTGFRSDVKSIDRQINELSMRVSEIEQRTATMKESQSTNASNVL